MKFVHSTKLSLISDLCHRGLATGIYTTNSPEACRYVADSCEANVMVVEDKKQLDKILQVGLLVIKVPAITVCKERKKSDPTFLS